MKKAIISTILMAAASLSSAIGVSSKDYSSYVNPFVGTDAHGHTFPAATYPFGMVQAGPDTRISGWDGCSGYHWSDSLILGFTHTHLSGTGCLDYGDILFMPVRGGQTASHFSHSKESAGPGIYCVWLEDPRVDVRIAAGRRMAMHEYRFEGEGERSVVVDLHHRDRLLASSLDKEGESTLRGWRQSRSWARNQDVYFHAEFSENVIRAEFEDSARVRLFFADGKEPLRIKIGISSVSCDNAKANLLSEKAAGDWDFEALAASTRKAWNEWLGRIDIQGRKEQKRTFYTALYHCAIHPSLYSDCNGEYRGMDREVHTAEGYDRYTVFSVWDVFRATFPLYEMIARDLMPDFLASMMGIWREKGRLPKWELAGNETNTMIGFNSVSIIADAWAKGLIDKAQLSDWYEAMKATAEAMGESYALFCRYGYDPAGEDDQNVSKTLEYAYDDWCIAQVAGALGDEEGFRTRIERSQYWKNIFDPESGFMRPRELGRWAQDFDPSKVTSDFTEANSWQYSFFVPQDIAGHIDAFGGVEAYTAKLDSLFAASHAGLETQLVDVTGLVGQYAHGNEPSHHVAYLYDFAGQPWKTQELTRRVCTLFYDSTPAGLCGNEDCGQMSAWYVLSAIGMYCVTPGTTTMALTSPIVRKAVINTGESTFEVRSDKPCKTYIRGAVLNGTALDAAVIDFEEILRGGSLSFKMGLRPSTWGSKPQMVPAIDPAYRYDAHFEEGFGSERASQHEFTMHAHPQTAYYNSYAAGGDDGLVDGVRGKKNWRAGGWQGYRGTDVDVVVDLLGECSVSSVRVGFLQDMNNYIWFPGLLEIFTSTDGQRFEFAGSRTSEVAIDEEGVLIEDWKVSFPSRRASFIKIVAHPFGEIPSWHRGYGDKSFIFLDEIGVE